MSNRRIQLIFTPQQVASPYVTLSLRFTVDAVNGNLINNNIFKFTQRPINPLNTTPTQNVFLAISTPEEMANLPIGAPLPDDPLFLFRLNHLDLTFATQTDALAAQDGIVAAATQLVNALNAADILVNPQTIWIGPPP